MKNLTLIAVLLWTFLSLRAQECPPEWVKYTYGGYMYDIQSDHKAGNQSETDFKNYLLNIARVSLARQVKVSVQESARLDKTAVDGNASIVYSSSTLFSTDLNMALVETRTMYNSATKEGYAIAFVNRDKARQYYGNELSLADSRINNSFALAESYLESGFKSKAQAELEKSLATIRSAEESLFWLNVFGDDQSELNNWQQVINRAEQRAKSSLAELKYADRIYLSCQADIFGKSYPKLGNELKGALAADGCSFADNPEDADWDIRINCTAEEYNKMTTGGIDSYLSYVNAHIVINKVSTSQQIYEDEISVKGGHNFGYPEAAKAAYKSIKEKLESIIKTTISQ